MLGIMLIDSGYGSAIPSCIVAHMNKSCAGSKSGLINVGDHILSVNGTSLVGMPLKLAIEQIKVRFAIYWHARLSLNINFKCHKIVKINKII